MHVSNEIVNLPFDASNEWSNYVLDGVQHKYRETITVFVSLDCLEICPWCFRGPRLFEGEKYQFDGVADLEKTINWLKKRKEVTSVLLTGGDALHSDNLLDWINELNKIPHVRTIRIGTRMPIYDTQHLAILDKLKIGRKRVIVVLHTVEADELDDDLLAFTSKKRITFLAQTPLLKTINDSPRKLVRLWRRLLMLGISPYYVFHCRPVRGNEKFILPIGEGYDIFQEAQNYCSGTTKRARYVMSANRGKLEMLGREGDKMLLKVHQARDRKDLGKIIRYPADEYWYK